MLLKRLFREHPLGTVGAAIILVLILVSVFADVLAPFRFGEMNLDDRLAEPSRLHPLGTDQLGRDFLSRLIHGARLSLFVGLAATTLHVVVAALVGGVPGFLGGRFDLLVQRFVDAWMSMPGLLLLLTIMSLAGRTSAVIALQQSRSPRAAAAYYQPVIHHGLPDRLDAAVGLFPHGRGQSGLTTAGASRSITSWVRRTAIPIPNSSPCCRMSSPTW